MLKDNIKIILKAQGRTQRELARDLGVSAPNLQYYLKGNITISILEKLAAALGVQSYQLLQPAETLNTSEPRNQETTPATQNETICPYCGKSLTITIK